MITTDVVSGIIEVTTLRGTEAPPEGPTDLLVEVPHGATDTEDYEELARLLKSPLPRDLIAFFHVNTDIGAPELGLELARRFVMARPEATVQVLRCRIPRTFIDCNRRIDATPDEFRAGGVEPGLMPWVRAAEDTALLLGRYHRYVAAVNEAASRLAPDGRMVLMHTFAPRTVGVHVDLDIVPSLRAAYAPEVFEGWPLRPEVDLIARSPEGALLVPQGLFDSLSRNLEAMGLRLGDSETYRVHPSTLGAAWVERFPGRVICPEVRRDLLVEDFIPFVPLAIDPARVAPIAAAMAAALHDAGA